MPRLKRFHKRLLLAAMVAALILAFCVGGLYYFVHFRFAESLSYAVTRTSKGRFALETGEASISLRKGFIEVRDARFHCLDTTNMEAWVDIRIPQLYFSLGSWKKVFAQRKLIVDSLAILRPVIGIHVTKGNARGRQGAVTATDLLNILDSTLRHLKIRSFSLQDAAFTLVASGDADPLYGNGDHIRLSVVNFAPAPGEGNHFFTSNAVFFSLGRQHWAKPAAGLTLDLARLAFDNRSQRFEVDSLSFVGRPDPTRPKIELAADRLYFTGHDRDAIYRDGGLLLDSLICVNPVVTLPPGGKADTAGSRTGRPPFFNYIDVRMIHVLNGRVRTLDAGGHTTTASTRKADLHIFGLHIDGGMAASVKADSIGIDLHNLEFLSKDSAHRLTIEEFGLIGNDAVFRQVRLAPTHPEPGRVVVFTAPQLLIRNISVPDLLRNHLRAEGAELLRPTISLTDTGQRKAQQGKMKLFYTTLHGIRQLIDAPYLDIIDGTQHFKLGGATPVEVTATGLQAHILLNKFFLSDSLIDIKQALPLWKVADFELNTPKVRLSAFGYELNGGRRSTSCREARISMTNGWQLAASNIFWDALNWDLFQATGTLHLDSLHVDSIAFQRPATNDSIQFAGRKVQLVGLTVGPGGIHWDHAKTALYGFSLRRPNINLTIAEGEWNSDSGVVARNITVGATVGHGALDLQIPVATLQASIHSIDRRQLPLLSLSIPRAGFVYAATATNDTLHVEGQLRLNVSSARIYPTLAAAVDLDLQNGSGSRRTGDAILSASGLAAKFHDAGFDTASLKKPDWRSWLEKIALTHGQLQYRTKAIKADVADCTWDPLGKTLCLADFAVSPILGRDASLKQAAWQSDYVTIKGRRLALAGIRVGGEPGHLSFEVPSMTLDGVQVEASRDKHIPFHHGMEKAMPTKLLAGLRFGLKVDTVRVLGSKVTYNEWPVTSSRWTSLTIDDLNGQLLNLHSRPDNRDTLRVLASARLFDGRIRRFMYNESYGDSLSGFTARCSLSAFDLTQLSTILVPTASVSVVRGHVDTIWSAWRGNRYAATGTMGLYFDRLKVSVLNKKDSSRRTFLPVVETWAANLLLPGRNKRESPIFFERDREKFIFNYWIKCQASGVLSALVPGKARTFKKRSAQVAAKNDPRP